MTDKSDLGDSAQINKYENRANLGEDDPKRIDKYEIHAKLGDGGSGLVYLARHVYLSRFYAIKLLKSNPESSQEGKARFLFEAGLLDKLKSPNILPVIDVGFYEDIPYIVTEYIQKGSLRNLLPESPLELISVERSIAILSDVGNALTYIHKLGIVHGDLKPENILLSEKDYALLGDFGNATDLGAQEVVFTPMIKGTYTYMSPEQFQGKICRKSDQYALGCIAYELFTGKQLFKASDFEAWKKKHETEPPRPLREIVPNLEENIEVATLTALAKEPEHRHTDVERFIQQLYTSTSSSRLIISNPVPQRSSEVETAPPLMKNATIDTTVPHAVQQSDAIINNLPAVAPPISTPASQTQDHPPSLYELQLPDSFVHLLEPALKASGLSIDNNTQARRQKKYQPYKYTQLLKNKEPLRCLLHIDDEFLNTEKYIDNLIVMLQAFNHDQFLIIFLDTPRFPPIQFRNLMKSERNGRVNYITKSDLEYLSSLSVEEYSSALADALELEDKPMETTVSLPEYTEVINRNSDVGQSPTSLLGQGSEEERKSLLKQLNTWERNRRFLEEQIAEYGSAEVPIKLHNQLEDAKEQIAILKERIAKIPDSNISNA